MESDDNRGLAVDARHRVSTIAVTSALRKSPGNSSSTASKPPRWRQRRVRPADRPQAHAISETGTGTPPRDADLSAAKITWWLRIASRRLVRGMSCPASSAAKNAVNWL